MPAGKERWARSKWSFHLPVITGPTSAGEVISYPPHPRSLSNRNKPDKKAPGATRYRQANRQKHRSGADQGTLPRRFRTAKMITWDRLPSSDGMSRLRQVLNKQHVVALLVVDELVDEFLCHQKAEAT